MAIDIGQSPQILERLLIAGCRDIHMDKDKCGSFSYSFISKNAINHDNNTVSPLYVAVKCFKDSFLDLLLQYIPEPVHLKHGLVQAVARGSLYITQKIIKAGADVNDMSAPGGAVLATALQEPNEVLVDFLLKNGANPNIAPMPTWLAFPCKFRNSMMLRHVRQWNNDNIWNLPNVHAKYRHLMTLVLSYSCNINSVSLDDGATSLWILCTDGFVCLALHLIKSGADVHQPNNDGVTPLQSVIESFTKCFSSVSITKRLIHMATILTLYITDWSKESWVSTLLTSQKTEEFDEGQMLVPPQLVNLLEERSTTPSLLQHIARYSIINALGINSLLKVAKLNLPSRLEKFLLLEDLETLHMDMKEIKELINHKKEMAGHDTCLCTVTNT